ncbi:MAG: DUF5680 domain-containing protein [Candidatus Pacebacteria bacterium]|nr:DUF5680 domain-containing protein [Candidatus Paceibacterota bacterium]
MNREKILEGAKEVFFKAMLAGYAGEGREKTTKAKSSDGYTTIEYSDGDFRVVDRYCTTPDSDFSAGTTVIFFENKPVWWMAYAGSYPAEVIGFLKEILRENYENGIFNGGRGLGVKRGENFIYINEVKDCDFSLFNGMEIIIYSKTEKKLGFHRYFGSALI